MIIDYCGTVLSAVRNLCILVFVDMQQNSLLALVIFFSFCVML